MSLAKFMGKLEEPLVTRQNGVEVTIAVKPSMLGRVVRTLVFTGAGKKDPRAFSIRIVSKHVPGVVCTAWLIEMRVLRKGEARISLLLEKPDLKALSGLMNAVVGVEVKDERAEE